MSKRIVIALGGNALGSNLEEQMKAVKNTAVAIADLIEEGNEIVIAHGNGPQVGMIQNAMTELRRSNPEKYVQSPLSVCVAMSQGYIGYDLQNAIRAELLNRGIYKTVSTILTQVVVDPYDEAFYKPSKIIGRVMTEEEAEAEEKKGNHVTKVADGYRRIVAAPKPVDIVEMDAIRALTDADQIVVACGGGGIPVLSQDNHLKGASAVIEKDLAAGKLAELLVPIDAMFPSYPKITVKDDWKAFAKNGNPLDLKMLKEACGQDEETQVRLYDESGKFIAIYQWKEKKYHIVKMFFNE